MQFYVVSVFFMLVLSSVEANICPDHSSCPGDEPCCHSSSGYRCCPVSHGSCCPDGLHCCPPLTTCIPGINICVPDPPNNAQRNRTITNFELPKMAKTLTARIGQCSSTTTWCTGDSLGNSCCPLPDAVCCSDQIHCCPKGYTCDINKKTCTENSLSSSSYRLALVTELKLMHCPDRSICPDGNTCCLMTSGEYGCCKYAQAVCCSDKIHCCPSGMICDESRQGCIMGKEEIPWLKQISVINGEQLNNSILN